MLVIWLLTMLLSSSCEARRSVSRHHSESSRHRSRTFSRLESDSVANYPSFATKINKVALKASFDWLETFFNFLTTNFLYCFFYLNKVVNRRTSTFNRFSISLCHMYGNQILRWTWTCFRCAFEKHFFSTVTFICASGYILAWWMNNAEVDKNFTHL